MTTAATTPGESRSRTASAIILGADAVLDAHPATAVQLAHACLRVGYSTVIPASWGDELLAAETIRCVDERSDGPLVYCACPHVSDRLLGVGDDLAPFLIPLVAPPVAAARHLRALAGEESIEVTFVGACPAGDDPAIDAHFTPGDFLEMLAHRGVVLLEQPEVFDSVLPPDRRRHQSLPGGVPSAETLWSEDRGHVLVEISDAEPLTELAQHLASGDPAVLDLGPALGCTCSGAVAGISPRNARSAVCASEPPRSGSTIVEASTGLDLSRPLDSMVGRASTARHAETHLPDRGDWSRSGGLEQAPWIVSSQAPPPPEPRIPAATGETEAPREGVAAPTATAHAADTGEPVSNRVEPSPRKRHPTAATRALAGAVPITNSGEGRALPRAYVARRPARRREGTVAEAEKGAPANPNLTVEQPVPGQQDALPVRIFATVPIASTRRPAIETEGHDASVAVASPDSANEPGTPAALPPPQIRPVPLAPEDATPAVRSEVPIAPVGALREHARRFARQSAERPVYLGILIAIVAVLSIALTIAAGRALRGEAPITAEPPTRGSTRDSLYGTSSSLRDTDTGETTRADENGVAVPVPQGSVRQSAAGNVAPPAHRPAPPAGRERGAGGGSVPSVERTRVDTASVDSLRRAVAADSVRRDSVQQDSLRRAAERDSIQRRTIDSLALDRSRRVASPADSPLQREREDLRRALEDRQRRIDSLQRWLDSARRTPPPAPPPR